MAGQDCTITDHSDPLANAAQVEAIDRTIHIAGSLLSAMHTTAIAAIGGEDDEKEAAFIIFEHLSMLAIKRLDDCLGALGCLRMGIADEWLKGPQCELSSDDAAEAVEATVRG